MGNYFKDKNLVLFYLVAERGLQIQLLPRFISDDATGQSLVVAVRGGPMSRDDFYGCQVEVDMSDGQSKVWAEKELCDYICSLTEEDRLEFEKRSARNFSVMEDIRLHWSDVTVQKVMILAYLDGSSIEDIEKDISSLNLDFHLVKAGGCELAAEFLLADFPATQAFRKILKPEYESWLDMEMARPDGNDDPNFGFEEGYDWSISNLGNIEAPLYFEDIDSEGDSYKSSPRLYYYSMDLKAIDKLTDLLYIPYRVEKLLSESQKADLKGQAPKILLDEIDYIARKVFKQAVDDFGEDQYRSYMAARSAAWNADMYDSLGGDGRQSVHLSGGVSISPTGKLIDD